MKLKNLIMKTRIYLPTDLPTKAITERNKQKQNKNIRT